MLNNSNISCVSKLLVVSLLLLQGPTDTVHGWFFKREFCNHNGISYPVGTTFGYTYQASLNQCLAYWCTRLFGKIPFLTTENCSIHQPKTTTPTQLPPGCNYEGRFYPPDTEISSGRQGNWCFFTYCDSYGQVISGDDFNCGQSSTTRRFTSRRPTPRPTTLPPGCIYMGKHYPPGTQISSGREGNWCFYTYCDQSGHVIHGDDFNCGPEKTTSPSPSPTPRTTTDPSVVSRLLQILERKIDALRKM